MPLIAGAIHRARPVEWRRNAQEGNLPKVFRIEASRKSALLTVAAVSALAMAQWFLASESAPAASAPGSFMVAQNPPRCGQDPQHPCPKEAPKQPAPKAPAQPAPPQPKQQAQPQQPPPPPKQAQPTPAQPQLKQQAQPKQEPQIERKPAVVQQPPTGQPQLKQAEPKELERKPAIGQQQPPTGQPQLKQAEPKELERKPAVGQQQPPTAQPQLKQAAPKELERKPAIGQQQPGQPQPKQTFQRVGPQPGQPAQAGGPSAANVQDLRAQRKEHTGPNGQVVIEEPDHRQIIRQGGQAFVRHDENERLFAFGQGRRERRGDGNYAIIDRPDGDEIITVTDDDGHLVRRFRRERDGREFILIDNRRPRDEPIFLNLPIPIIGIPQDQYIVDTAVAPEPFIYQTLEAPPLVPIERPYSLDEIRYNVALRDRMRRIDVDTITFDLGSWEVTPDQIGRLQLVAQAIQDIVAGNPNEVFLIEGHTDAVGNDVDNLSLSDRRAETVASVLTESFQIPPENLTTQGYGSHFLKIQTPDANRQNRRVTVRRITPLLVGQNG
jgi:outer membrane protein OmpA-like peptidoglycan-associated protein